MCGSARISRASASCWASAALSSRAGSAELGVESVRQVVVPVGADRGERRPHLRVGRVGRGEREVVAQRTDEDVVFLGDQRDPASPFGRVEVGDADPADVDVAVARAFDAGQQPGQGRLPGSGRADDGQPFARLHVEIDAVQDVPPAAVRERRPADLDPGAGGRARSTGLLGRDLVHPEHAGVRGDAPLELLHELQQPVHRVDRLLQVQRRRRHVAEAHQAVRDQRAADQQHRPDRQGVAGLDHREDHRAQGQGAPPRLPHGRRCVRCRGRCAPRSARRASTVRAPSAVAVTESVSSAVAAPSAR